MNSEWSGDVTQIDKVKQQGRINTQEEPSIQKGLAHTFEDFGKLETVCKGRNTIQKKVQVDFKNR